MIIGVRDLTWAKFTSGGNGSAAVYTGGAQETDLMVRADQSEERSDVRFHADDHMIDRDNSVTGATVALELAKLPANALTDMLGYVETTGNNPDLQLTGDEAPYVGVGFVHVERYKGTRTYVPYWYYKVQFSRGQRSFNTKGDSIEFQTESLEGQAMAVQLVPNGPDVYYATPATALTSLTAAVQWLGVKAGISTGG